MIYLWLEKRYRFSSFFQLTNTLPRYVIPQVPEDYVHRIGRTGRAGCSGKAVSLVMDEEIKLLRAIERLIKKDIPVYDIHGFSEAKIVNKNTPSGRYFQNSGNKKRNKSQFFGKRTRMAINR